MAIWITFIFTFLRYYSINSSRLIYQLLLIMGSLELLRFANFASRLAVIILPT